MRSNPAWIGVGVAGALLVAGTVGARPVGREQTGRPIPIGGGTGERAGRPQRVPGTSTGAVYRVKDVGDVNVYVLAGDAGITLIDTGFPGKADAVLRCVRDLGYAPSDVHTIVLTHGDADHMGNAAALKAATGARVAVGEADAPSLTGAPYERGAGIMRAFHAAVRQVMNAAVVEPDVLLRDGDVVSGLRVHSVPGHTKGSIALSDTAGTVFSGDALLGDRQGGPKSPPRFAAYDGTRLRASTVAIEALRYTLLLPGHGEPVRPDE